MTVSKNRKKAVRAFAAEHGVKYTTALRHFENSASPSSKVISVCSVAGGTGKTTLTLALAKFAATELGLRVLVVDTAVQGSDLRSYLNATHPGIEALTESKQILASDLAKVVWAGDGFDVVFSPEKPEKGFPVYYTGAVYSNLVAGAKDKYDVVLLDTPTAEYYHDLFRRCVLPVSDTVVTVSTSRPGIAKRTQEWVAAIESEQKQLDAATDAAKLPRFVPFETTSSGVFTSESIAGLWEAVAN